VRLGVMQPYFFPYLGHFSLIAHSDAWVVFDITQYTPKTWINRNRVLHPTAGWNWISLPLANSSIHTLIHEAKLLDVAKARSSTLGKLSHYRRTAPYWRQVERLVEETFDMPEKDDSLTRLNVRSLAAVCRYLELPFEPRICSELDLGLPSQAGAGEWALEICCRVGAEAYLNPVGGRALFDPEAYRCRGVDLQFMEAQPFSYQTPGYTFEPGLSVLDVLMWNDPSSVARTVREACVIHRASD
jgi:hypothetical protein